MPGPDGRTACGENVRSNGGGGGGTTIERETRLVGHWDPRGAEYAAGRVFRYGEAAGVPEPVPLTIDTSSLPADAS
jgi:hypothetical protein